MTNKFRTPSRVHMAVWGMSLALTGCFNNDADPVVVPPVVIDVLKTVPAAASESITALLTYQRDVLARPQADQDKAEPIDLSNITLPVSDNTEPAEV